MVTIGARTNFLFIIAAILSANNGIHASGLIDNRPRESKLIAKRNALDPTVSNSVAAGFLFADQTDLKLSHTDPIDANLSRLLNRNGPDMRPSRDFNDFSDITLNVSKRAWKLLYEHTSIAVADRLDLARPAIVELLRSSNVSLQCREAIDSVFEHAKQLDSWAIKLLNSWGNFPTIGLFEGTYSDIGSFHGCINIPENIYIDHAHYCSITFRPVLPSRSNYELVVNKEPIELIELFDRNQTEFVSHLPEILTESEPFKRLKPKAYNRNAFSDILEHSQYHHYVYYKVGTCWPIQCSPFDVRRIARLAARRMILMNGPTKCYSRHERDYEQSGSIDIEEIRESNGSAQNNDASPSMTGLVTIEKKLVISIWDLNHGIFIWKPHFNTSHKVASIIVISITIFILLMTLIDLILNRIPRVWEKYQRSLSHQYKVTNIEDVDNQQPCETTSGQLNDPTNNGLPLDLDSGSPDPKNYIGFVPSAVSNICELNLDEQQQVVVAKSHEPNKKLSFWMTVVDDCSIISSASEFFTVTEAQKKQITCLDGIRCITMVWIILTHTMMYNDWSAFARTREVERAIKSPVAQPLFNASYLVDTFFLLSGLLSAYTTFRQCKGIAAKFDSFSYILSRWLRLTPQIFFTSMIYIVIPTLSYGPHWFSMVGEYSENCSDNWWVNVLHLQAFVKTDKMCNFVTWWISIDFFYHFMALSVIWVIIYAGHRLGFLALASLIIVQVGWQIKTHYQLSLPPNVLSTIPQTGAMWTEMTLGFIWRPYDHSVPFFFGFYIGYLMALKRKLIMRRLNARIAVVGWLLAGILFLGQSYSTYWWVIGQVDYSRFASTLSHTLCPIIWASALCWTILACQHGYGSCIDDFLSSKVFIILGKASYMVYLSHFQVLFMYFGNQSLLLEPSEITMFYIILGNIILSTLHGIFLCVVYELPWLKIQKKIMKYVDKST